MTKSYAAQTNTEPLAPFEFNHRSLRSHDVLIEILYCGVCHTDVHIVKNEWKQTIYPVVPGHEIIGKIKSIGTDVTRFKVGDFVGVGCMVDSCRTCSSCTEHLEQYCENGSTLTYNSYDKKDGQVTYGGYSEDIVVNEEFVLQIPKNFKETDLPGVAPLLCAGITTYSPLRHWKIGKGSSVGVVGLGGLGHMAIKLAHAMGAHVTLFTTSSNKIEDAKKMGADCVVLSKDRLEMTKHKNSLDFIIDTVGSSHSLDSYTELLKRDGTLCLVGLPEHPHPSPRIDNLIFKRRKIGGSLIGGIQETQEMLNFCADHGITSDIELIPIQKINEAYERLLKSDVKYRFVIDNSSLKSI